MLPSSLPVFVLPIFNQKGIESDITDPKIAGSAAFRSLFKGGRAAAQERTPYWATLNTWYNILDSGAPAAFVLSPTAMVPKDFFQKADSLFGSLNVLQSYDRFDVWLFNQDSDILQVQTGYPPNVGLVYAFQGMYAYLITRGGILKLLPHMLPVNSRIDAKISYAVKAYDIKVVHSRDLTVRRPDTEEYFEMPSTASHAISNVVLSLVFLGVALAGVYYVYLNIQKRYSLSHRRR